MIAALLALLTCGGGDGGAPEQRWPISGTVLEVRGASVVLDHQPIPGFMDAMVMDLAADPAALEPLRAGRRIEAELVVGAEGSRLEAIQIVGGARAVAATAQVTPPLALGEALATLQVPLAGGGEATLGAGQGAPVALTFLFTTCPLPEYCPLLATKLAALQERIRGRAQILAITLDPETDTPGVLSAYAEQVGADPAVWRFGRLEPPALEALLDRAGVVRFEGEVGIRHALRLLALDADGRLVRVESSNRWDPDVIAEALIEAPTEATAPAPSGSPAPTPLDQVPDELR